MSQAVARHRPPPMAAPLTAAITGWCMRRRARMTSSRSSIERRAIEDRVSPAMFGIVPDSSRSAPEQNPSPAPVTTTTRVSLSALTSSRAARNGIITSNAIAFMRSGRLSVISETCGRGFSIRVNAMGAVLAACRSGVSRPRAAGGDLELDPRRIRERPHLLDHAGHSHVGGAGHAVAQQLPNARLVLRVGPAGKQPSVLVLAVHGPGPIPGVFVSRN